MNDRVEYFCARAEHQSSEPEDAVTMHEDRWAYCSGGAADGHDWRPTGGMSLERVKRFVLRHPIRVLDTTDQRSD
jgi:hypothetical protein